MALSEKQQRRWFLGWTVTLGVLTLAAGAMLVVGLARDWSLISDDGRRVTGTVVSERTEQFCLRNLVDVRYELDGLPRRASIPTKGRGLGGLCIRPYFYKRGDSLKLLVDPGDPGHVRTAARWSPLAASAGAVFAWSFLTLLVVLVMRWFFLRKAVAAPANAE